MADKINGNAFANLADHLLALGHRSLALDNGRPSLDDREAVRCVLEEAQRAGPGFVETIHGLITTGLLPSPDTRPPLGGPN